VTYFSNSRPSNCGTNAFNGCDELQSICLPVDFKDDSFCGKTIDYVDIFRKSPYFGPELQNQINHCYDLIVCSSVNASITMRMNASEWVDQTNECYEYVCDNESGHLMSWSNCNSSETIERECIIPEMKWNIDFGF